MSATPPPDELTPDLEAPIRAELFGVERFEQHAQSLAAAQVVSTDSRRGRQLTPRVLENSRVLLDCYRSIARATQSKQPITPAAEWLIDNFHLVEEQIREIRDDLPTGFYRQLPKLSAGHLKGYPRVYGVAWAFIAHSDSRFDPEVLRRFVVAYQKVQPLTIGELWALAIALRVVLVENLRRLAEHLVRSREARQRADLLADQLLSTRDPSSVPPDIVLDLFGKKPLPTDFTMQLLQRLRDLDPKVLPVLMWLDRRLAEQGTTADEVVRAEHQKQAASSATVRNIITSMRLMSAFDWSDFFESVSLVDEVMRAGSDFGSMDFATRDRYRHAIEELSWGSGRSEIEVARLAVERAGAARAATPAEPGREPTEAEPGYHLVARGRRAFERQIGFRIPRSALLARAFVKAAVPGYLGTILLGTALILAFPLLRSYQFGVAELSLVLLGLLAAVPASELAISLIQRAVTHLIGPRPLPRLELRDGVPEHLRTIVVMPTLLTAREPIEEQVERLEVHYLANPDGHLRFALLSDWADAPNEEMPADDELLSIASEGISRLNRRHGPAPGGGERFLLLHRRRVWTKSERRWMGWERKRGKLHELNQLLRGSTTTTFIAIGGQPPPAIPGVRFVITLDADTRMPREAAYRLVGTIAHPLNRPRFDPEVGRVVEGYGIVQPRITPSLPTDREGSLFQKAYSGPAGLDPYAAAVSDVYQDLFQEGSYTGKGIYDIDAFEAALEGKVPESAMLSHDLFEGICARAALASDVELIEEYPAHYEGAAARQHRWARGDWQLLPWVFGRGPKMAAGRAKFSLPAIGRWKMIDNLRRTLLAPTAFLTLVAAWLLPVTLPEVWTSFVLVAMAVPALLAFLFGLKPRAGISLRTHFTGLLSDVAIDACQFGLNVTFLADQASLMVDAILLSLGRVYLTGRNRLQWVTAAQSSFAGRFDLAGMYLRMAGGVFFAASVGFALLAYRPESLPIATPFLLLWMAAPLVARWISLPPRIPGIAEVSAADRRTFRLAARRTWRFFETFVAAEDHALPPDNFQEEPRPVVAHRTSPTNLGLSLLSTLSAHDFGWIGTVEAVERIEAAFAAMGQLERYRGHFYNWYETRDLRPLEPKYISSVDSGNLAGHLVALANGCRELIQRPVLGPRILEGLDDNLRLLREAQFDPAGLPWSRSASDRRLGTAMDAMAAALAEPPVDGMAWAARLTLLKAQAETLVGLTMPVDRTLPDSESSIWASAARACVASHTREAAWWLPWWDPDAGTSGPGGRRGTPVAPERQAIEPWFRTLPALSELPDEYESAARELEDMSARLRSEGAAEAATHERIDALALALRRSAREGAALIRRLSSIAETAERMFMEMDFSFLFDRTRRLFSIGYRVLDGSLDPGYYDLLASEARLTSFIAIAKGDAPSSHWFRLGRPLAPVSGGSALISWSGSMFEYLMPELVMRSPAGSLLRQTCERVVRRHMAYGAQRNVPWGVSESAYNVRDLEFTYQYSNFGVPGLGLRRGLQEDIVVAPYATALAALILPSAAAQNLVRLAAAGGRGAFGYYEALDYTPERLPEGSDVAIVRAYMAHHQGMSLVALGEVVHDDPMRARFHAEPMMRATELLLQERTPRGVLVARPRVDEVSTAGQVRELAPPVLRRFSTPHDAVPRTHLLSNGRYGVLLTAAGSGYSRWRDLAITRWREDATRDDWGSYVLLRDRQSGRIWSAGHQPSGVETNAYEASFYEDHAEIVRRDGTLMTSLEVVVSAEDDAEVRRVSIANLGMRTREIEITSYAELCLAPHAADLAHRAFSNLFVQTEFVPELGALLATRRTRSANEPTVWVAHVVIVEGETSGELEFETDRARFLGRGRELRDAQAIRGGALSGTVGSVLDPILSLRRTVRIPPGSTAHLVFSTVIARDREHVVALAEKYRDAQTFDRTMTRAWTQAQVQLHHLGIRPDEANVFQRLANGVLFPDPALRPAPETLARTALDLSTLWARGISGDRPIVLVRIDAPEDIEIIRQLLRAHEYWRMKQLAVDIVILNENPASYAQDLQSALAELVRGSQLRLSADTEEVRGNIFLLRADQTTAEERAALQGVARAVLLSRRGTLGQQVLRAQRAESPFTPLEEVPRAERYPEIELPRPELEFFNGIGGFADHGREYVTVLQHGRRSPQPWINVIANPAFGFLVSESGSGFTWSLNSHENRLTPWSNDPVSDPSGEAFYLRDEVTGESWTPTALPMRDETATYLAYHGQGYSRFRHGSHGIDAELLQFVPADDPIKISHLVLHNRSGRVRRISVTAYLEWVLGRSPNDPSAHVVTELDGPTGALFARSAWRGEFGGRIAFADLAGQQTSWTCDRTEFLGRNGTPARPRALTTDAPLSGRVGAGLDPCAALRTVVELRPGARAEVVCFLGQTDNRERAQELIARYRAIDVGTTLRDVARRWDDLLGTIQIATPEPAMDRLVNRWLLYQTLSCRMWARAGFYQAGGAYGFRDQLQDAMSLSVVRPDLVREHLLRAASHQFVAGDVQHWWHPPSGRGVRTRISDDLLWLPYAVAQFIEASGDRSVLDEMAPFLEGPALLEGHDDAYFEPRQSDTAATLFEHCARALDRSLGVGRHGLPRMGSGDWNDGMNRVGHLGQGESVWLGWFLFANLKAFVPLADARGESERAATWRAHMSALQEALERDGWDGEWYRRAYFDDGTPLGSASNEECRIDSIAQSWAVISGAAAPERAARGMAAVQQQLVRPADDLVLLFTPPFDKTPLDPGYIKGYVPGIRENGGQYTHAAVWAVIAHSLLGDGDRAAELFRMLNPITHSSSRDEVQRYGSEPYAVAADVYAEPPHVGRGGWTWYTGAAGWLHRAGLEWILGFRVHGATLLVNPCIPRDWSGYAIRFRYRTATYDIRVENPHGASRGVASVDLDGARLPDASAIPLVDDGGRHHVQVVLGAS